MSQTTQTQRPVKRHEVSKLRWTWEEMKNNKTAYFMIAPFLLLFIIFTVLPVGLSILLSLTDFNMLQVPNIVRNPLIWIPSIVSSAILGPVSSALLKMVSNPVGSGMGSAGLVGQFMSYDSMTANGVKPEITLILILIMHFILPAVISLGVAEAMRKMKLIKPNDLKLEA